MSSAEKIVRAFLDAYNAHDIAAIADLVAEDAVYADAGMDRTFEGKDQFVGYVQGAFDALPDCRWELESIVASGNRAAYESTYSGTMAPGSGTNTTNVGQPMSLKAATVVDTREGLIVRFADYHSYAAPAT